MKAHFEMFAAYNAWANRRLYEAAAKLDEAALKRPAGAFFGSLYGTLNHLLVGDLLWMNRFEGAGPAPTSLDGFLHERFNDLRAARVEMDERISGYVAALTDDALAGDIAFRLVVMEGEQSQRLDAALSHLFNHQTHHRGQCHHMLTAAGEDAPPLDLMFYLLAPEG